MVPATGAGRPQASNSAREAEKTFSGAPKRLSNSAASRAPTPGVSSTASQ